MLTFYFLLSLFLFQVFYWIKLSGIEFQNHYIHWIANKIFYSGLGLYSRILLVGSACFLSGNWIKETIVTFLNKKFVFKLLLLSWILLAVFFVYFDHLPLKEYHKSWFFLLLFVSFYIPFFLNIDRQPSVSQDKNKIKRPKKYNKNSPFSVALPTRNGLLPVNNPQRGIYILGGAGSGKTRYGLEPLLYAMIRKGYCGLVYDYDFEGIPVDAKRSYCLSKFVYNCYLQLEEKDRKKIDFKTINFSYLNKSVRINPIDPVYLSNRAFLEEYVTVLLNNLNPGKKDDFWHLSTKSLLKGIIIYLANQANSCCTLPHVLTLATKPIDKILGLVEKDSEAYAYASSIFDAYRGGEKTSGQLVGIVASFKTSLQPLINKELFWVLSKNEIDLSINATSSLRLLCIGNFPPAKSAFSPVISLLLTVCFKSMYGHGRSKSFVAIDELPTLYIPGISELPATARKYGISTIACIQSNAQLEDTYGSVGAKKIQDILSNQFIGNCGVSSSAYGSTLFGKEEYFVRSTSSSETYHGNDKGSNKTVGENISIHERDRLKSQEFASLDVGFFSGRVVESDGVFFQEAFKNVSSYNKDFKNESMQELPDMNNVTDNDVIDNQKKIELDIDLLLGCS